MTKTLLAATLFAFTLVNHAQAEELILLPSSDNSAINVEPEIDTGLIVAEEEHVKVDSTNDQMKGKFQIGTRFAYKTLTNADSGHQGGTQGSGTYLGTIYALEDVQNYLPINLFAKYFFSEYVAAELAWDSVEAKTLATSIDYSGIKSDGTATAYGPTISVVGHIPNSTPFTPYASLGLGYYFGDFEESDHWGKGYPDPSVYDALGQPDENYNGKSRTIEIDSTVGILVGTGCTYHINENWLLDLNVQYTKLEMDVSFYTYHYGVKSTSSQDGYFPMDNVAIKLGLAYQF